MTTTRLSPAAKAAQDAARQGNGRFGEQARAEPDSLNLDADSWSAALAAASAEESALERMLSAAQDRRIAAEIASAVVLDDPPPGCLIELLRDDDEVDEYGGYRIALGRLWTQEGNLFAEGLSRPVSWSSAHGTGVVSGGPWVGYSDRCAETIDVDAFLAGIPALFERQ